MNAQEKPAVNLQTHNLQVIEEAKSPLNVWGTGEELHREPNLNETDARNALVFHYIERGGIAHLQEEHTILAV